uniref:Putative ORF1 n=1 Tax=Caledonia beadlet anemone dicistro-like virus 2 TaxID=2021908 RepID=A0A221LFB9_9VIRU|nr:putative ORF1 [Caledonia beadlet anemone dicistro-like virus 2]
MQQNKNDWESSETIGPLEKLNKKQVFVHTFFGMIIFDDDISNFIPTIEVLRQYLEDSDKELTDLLFSQPAQEIKPLAIILSSLFFDEIFDELIFELPMRIYSLFPTDFDFSNEGRWFELMDQWKNIEDTHAKALLICGDVESNPGPIPSRPVPPRNNDPRSVQLEKAIWKKEAKVRSLIREIQRMDKHINPRAQGLVNDFKKVIKNSAQSLNPDRIDCLSQDINSIARFIDNHLPSLQASFETTGVHISDNLVSIKDDLIKVLILLILFKLFMQFKKYRCAIVLVLLFVCQHYNLHSKIIELVKELLTCVSGATPVISPTVDLQERAQTEVRDRLNEIRNRYEDRPRAQMDTEELIYSPAFQLIGKIMFAFLAFVCIKKIPGKQDWDTYITRLDRIPKAHEGSKKILDFTTEYWNLAHESIKMMVLGKTREELRAAAGIYPEIDEWAMEVRKYLDLEERNKIDVDILIANKVEKLWSKGLEFKADKLLSREADRLVSSMLMPARTLFEYVTSSPIKGGGPRMKPVCVWLCGESGIGKTEVIYPLCIDVLRQMGLTTENDYQHQVYARQVETEFWDGYKGQKIVIYDDAFQKKDDRVNGNPELFEVIRSCNTFPQHLHMAALHEKNTFSAAELMLYTTNEMDVEIASLTYPAAFKNRMYEHAYVVQLKPQYTINKTDNYGNPHITLDHSKLNPEKPIDLDIYLFQKMNQNYEKVGEPLEYKEFSNLITEEWMRKKKESFDKLEFLKQYATRPMAQVETFYDCDFDFASDISTRLHAGENLTSIEYDYAADEEKFNQYISWKSHSKPVTVWQKYIDRFDSVYSSFKNKFTSLKNEVLEIIKDHPYLSMLGLVGTFLTIFGLYTSISNAFGGKDEPDIESGEIEAEINHSGDSRTIKATKPHVEISASGDIRTQKTPRPVVEISTSGDVRTQKVMRPQIESDNDANYLADFINGRRPQSQGCSDPSALMLVTDVLYKNTYKLLLKHDSKVVSIGNVTFLTGWVAAMPYHFLQALFLNNYLNGTFILTQDGVHDLIQFPVSHIAIDKNNELVLNNAVRLEHLSGDPQDCVVFCLHKQMCQPHRNILPHIVKQDDLKMLTGYMKGTMSTFYKHHGQFFRMYHTFGDITSVDSSIEIDLDLERNHHYTQRSYYSYQVSTVHGDCGSVIGIFSKRMIRKIIGMHIAGDANGIAYACPWTFERIDTALSKLEKISGPIVQMEYALDTLIDPFSQPALPDGGFVAIGKSSIRNGQATKTALLRSRIYGKLRQPTMAPAILKPIFIDGKMINPLMNGLKKCGKTPALLDNDEINACSNDISRLIRTNFANIDINFYKRVLSYEQAVKGADDDFMTSVNRVTSPGFPYSQQRSGQVGKTKWLGSNEDFDFTSENSLQMQQDVKNLINDCKNGIIRGVYCADTLKDEKRDLEKVAVGKTRVFSACPIHFVLAFRQYFLGFSAWCMHNRVDNEIAVGTNQYSLDWNKIALRLKRKGNPVIAGDFSNFDGSLNAQILWAILEIINDWYDDDIENKKIRIGLWTHVVHSTHVFDDNVYMWTHSQPSGNPFTVIINSIYNSIVMRMAWRIVMSSHGLSGMNHFNKFVSMVSYGDDNVLNISQSVIDLFNQQTIAEALESIAHTYTDETKSGEMIKFRSLKDVNFLKRSFVFSEELQRYIAPLEERVIYEMLNWTRNTIDPDEILMMNVETAAREMALHGRNKFNNFVSELRQIENCFRIPPCLLTYPEYLYDMKENSQSFFN